MRFNILFLFIAITLNLSAQKNTVIIVSMDGFRWDYPVMYHTPNLDKLATEGVKAHSLVPSFPSVTFPNHYTIATGLYPDHHGLVHNSFYDSTLHLSYSIGNRKVVENPRFYSGEPIWNTAERQGVKTASFFWVGSETAVNGRQPTYWKKYDGKVSYESRIDTVVSWLRLPEEKRPRLILLYFSEPDHTGHTYGPNSNETRQVVEHMDSLIGKLTTDIKKTPQAKNIHLIIVSDHGMGAISETKNIVLDEIFPKEWCLQTEGHNPFIMINPKQGFADSIISRLEKVQHLHAWKKEEIPAYLNYGKNSRVFPVVVLADSGYSLRWASKKVEKGGAHGYDINNTDMHGIFYATGRDFKKHYPQPSFQNIQIYNLVAKLLDIEPAPNDGNINAIKKMLKRPL
ncbi:MAG TPA: ectonucleotide pyrophosphatase/phosphodiesterase [Bacteroidales bacterium]|nr:ectonucleotide pyrophosphatase/phosphodiesterase [Bacteroidales bacterium]